MIYTASFFLGKWKQGMQDLGTNEEISLFPGIFCSKASYAIFHLNKY